MGNRLCKKKADVVDNVTPKVNNNNNRSPSKFDRIINRLHLTPATWKSESHLNKESKRSKSEERKKSESIFYTKPLSKSSDWTDVDLEVPSKDDEHIHLRNPKLNLIFDNEQGTPTPPPRQHKGTNFKEKLGKIARSGLQAIQGDKNNDGNKVPVEEPLMVKRQINYKCPLCDSDEKNHNRDHHHHNNGTKQDRNKDSNLNQSDSLKKFKNSKRKKNLSVISLPNYNDLKLSIADDSDLTKLKAASKSDLNSSRLSLQGPGSKKLTSSQSTGKLETYMTRCRSFGSILPQQLRKFMPQKPKPTDVTSDDSLAALEDWDLGLIEHYNPKDASLPRPRKPVAQRPSESAVLSNIESLIVKEEDIAPQKPKVPGRKIESLVKKFNKESSNAHVARKAPEDVCLTPPPSPVSEKQENLKNKSSIFTIGGENNKNIVREDFISPKSTNILQTNTTEVDDEPVEHSSLMRILQEFSVKDKLQENATNVGNESNFSSLTPSLVEYEKNLNNSLVEEFINAEKGHTRAVYS